MTDQPHTIPAHSRPPGSTAQNVRTTASRAGVRRLCPTFHPGWILLLSIICVTCFAPRTMAAQATEVIDVWPAEPPGPQRDIGEEQDITKPDDPLIAGRRIIKLANVTTPQAHVYLPPTDRRTGSAVVVCPGGGFSILAWDLEGTEVAEWLNSIGVTAVVLKYRVPTRQAEPNWLAPVQDAQRTLSRLRPAR